MANKEIKTVADLTKAFPQLCDQIATDAKKQAVAEMEANKVTIESIDALAEAFPELCNQITTETEAKILDGIAGLSREEAVERFPDLVTKLTPAQAPGLDPAKGFILASDDPYGAGVARYFAAQAVCQVPALPCMLPYKVTATRKALDSYIIRAQAAGDSFRVKAAQAALKKCK